MALVLRTPAPATAAVAAVTPTATAAVAPFRMFTTTECICRPGRAGHAVVLAYAGVQATRQAGENTLAGLRDRLEHWLFVAQQRARDAARSHAEARDTTRRDRRDGP